MKIEEEGIILELPNLLYKKAFYNPQMKVVRSLNIEIYSAIYKNAKFLDLLASIGANSLRIKKELNFDVYANDISKEAIEYLRKNCEINKLEINIFNENAKFLDCKLKEKFDIIDIDPFGSPSKFLPYILNFLKKRTLLSLTATDIKTLAENPLKRYGIFCTETDVPREIAVRNLITFSLLFFSRYNYISFPIFSYSEKHFVKVYLLLEKTGKKKVENFVKSNIFALSFCKNCLNKKIGIYEKCECNSNFFHIFPFYIGKLFDENVVRKAYENSRYSYTKKIFERALKDFVEDYTVPATCYNTHLLAKKLKKRVLSIEEICKNIKASKNYLFPTYVRTNEFEKLKNLFINL